MKGLIASIFILLSTSVFGQPSPDIKKFDSLVSVTRYDEALKFLRSELVVYGDAWIPYIANRCAFVLILQGKLDEAETELRKVKLGNDRLDDAITKTNLGFLYLNKARNDLALESLQSALNSFREAHNERSLEAATCLAYLSQVYLTTGKLNQAEENGNIALDIRRGLKGEDSEEVAASYNDLGLIYGQRDPEQGLEYYEKALEVYSRIHGDEHPKIAIANTNIGFAYRGMKLYGDAITNLEAAESIWKKIYPDGHPNQALALFNLGLTYSQMGNKTSALGYFDRALAIDRKFYGAKHPDIAYILNQIGMLNLGDNQYDAALGNFQDALIANAPVFNSKEARFNPSAKDFYNGKVLLYTLRQKALTLEARHFGKTLKFEELKWALFCLQTCDSLIDEIRYHSTDENDKIELGASANEVYEDGVRIAQAMSEMTLEARPYQESSFYFAEKSKSAVLQESIADSEAKSFAGIPAQLLDDEKTLKSTISLLSQKLSQNQRQSKNESSGKISLLSTVSTKALPGNWKKIIPITTILNSILLHHPSLRCKKYWTIIQHW
ncbi:MAG TPA: tetratricopeptide repeat protein [Cyclobacteriaceae bacterium]|nr:tetratricopeptide repeat protein [Cyclobacteriaceae bacterium]